MIRPPHHCWPSFSAEWWRVEGGMWVTKTCSPSLSESLLGCKTQKFLVLKASACYAPDIHIGHIAWSILCITGIWIYFSHCSFTFWS
jgi:hypothetical protein